MRNPFSVQLAVEIALLALMTIVLTACGGSSSSSGSSGNKDSSTTISGIVTDPPINGAAVVLRSSNGEALSKVKRTGEDGEFTLDYSADADLAGATLEARGGTDADTGMDFTGITFSAPVEKGETAVVSPLTSLVVEEAAASGQGMAAARSAVAGRLGLSEDQIDKDPADSPAVQQASLVVSRSAVALGSEGGGMERYSEALRNNGNVEQAASALSDDQTLSESARERIETLKPGIEAINNLDEASADAMLEAANRISARNAVADFLTNRLGVGEGEETSSNVDALAEAIWKANDKRGIASRSSQLKNVVRYVVGGYGIAAEDFADSEFSVPPDLAGDDPVAQLADVQALDPEVPLAKGEELGSDNEARLEYFLSSRESPLYQAERLFDDVVDDGVLDPVFGEIARGFASAGLFDRAERVVQTRIFQAEERADAFSSLGKNVAEFERTEQAEAFFDAGLAEYQEIVDATGVENLREQDAEFYQVMARRFQRAGLEGRVIDAVEPVQSFIEANAGEPWSVTYGRIVLALIDGAKEAVEQAEAAGLSSSAVNEAISAIDVVFDAAKGTGESNTGSSGKFFFRAFYISEAAKLYARVGARERGLEAIDRFEAILKSGQTDLASRFVQPMASVYGRFGQLTRFENFLNNVVEPIEPRHAEEGRAALAIYKAIEDAESGNVAAGIERVKARYDEVEDQIEFLTYRGSGKLDSGFRYLSRLLFDRGLKDEAIQVADAAWDLASSEALKADDSVSITDYVSDGCRKVARLYEWIEAPETAKDKMKACWDLAQNRASGADDTRSATRLLADGYLWVGLDQEVDPVVETLYSEGSGISDPGGRHNNRLQVAELWAKSGNTAQANRVLDEATGLLPAIDPSSAEEGDIKSALSDAASTAETYNLSATEGRRGVADSGSLSPEKRSAISDAREKAAAVITGGDNVPGSGSWEGYLKLSNALPSSEDSAERETTAVERLANARAFEEARELARSAENRPERNDRLSVIAGGYTKLDDYPGSDFAKYDYDGDGQPDFLSPATSQRERNESSLSLDSDIDDDGVPTATDRTPYCAECGGE